MWRKDLNPSNLAVESVFFTTVLCALSSLSLETVGTMLASVRCQKPVAKWQREHQLLSSSECSCCYYFTVQGRWNERGSRSIGASLHWSYITKKKCTQFNEVARVNSFLLRPKYAFLKEIVSDKNKPTEILSLFPVRGHFQVIVIFGELSSPFWGLKGAGYMAGCTIA